MNAENSHKVKLSKIKVVVRKRPANHRESSQNDIDIIETESKNTIVVKELKNKVDLTKYIEEHRFTFDRAYGDESTNQEIYDEMLKPMIDAAFHKTKITCFAYGQTGSGKTYTMLGNTHIENDKNPSVPGLYLLTCNDVFNNLTNPEYSNLEIWVSFYEIYCNKLFDLLNNKNILQAREDGKGNICIVGLIEKNCKNIKELINLIEFGLNSRTVGITGANLDSSRSHAILQISIKTTEGENYSKISFIDLAGNERSVDTIDTNKKTKIDGAEINKSLLALKECIRALDMEKRHKPFRGSKLTLVLRDSFIGNCLTLMIANISPCLSCSEHTINTLRYADRVKELRKPRHEKEENYNHNNNKNDYLSDLLMMPKLGGQNIKYNVEVKKELKNPNNLIINHNYNYMKIKTKNNNFNGDKNIQKPDKNIMKIDDVIKNEKILPKYNLNKKIRDNSENKKNIPNNFTNVNTNNSSNIYYSSNTNIKTAGNKQPSPENYNVKYSNYSKVEVEQSPKKNKKTETSNADNYISKYKDVQIKNDDDYQQYSNIHEDLINNILKEEDDFISQHKQHIDNMVESIKKEMNFIHEVDKPGSDIEEYTSSLDKLLLGEVIKINKLRSRLNQFRIMLKDEEALANKFDEDEILVGAEDDTKENEKSKSLGSSNNDSFNENTNTNNKPNYQFRKK